MNYEDLKLIQKYLHEAYKMNDKILIGYAINRLDTLIFEETQQLQEGHVSDVVGTESVKKNQSGVKKCENCKGWYNSCAPDDYADYCDPDTMECFESNEL